MATYNDWTKHKPKGKKPKLTISLIDKLLTIKPKNCVLLLHPDWKNRIRKFGVDEKTILRYEGQIKASMVLK